MIKTATSRLAALEACVPLSLIPLLPRVRIMRTRGAFGAALVVLLALSATAVTAAATYDISYIWSRKSGSVEHYQIGRAHV